MTHIRALETLANMLSSVYPVPDFCNSSNRIATLRHDRRCTLASAFKHSPRRRRIRSTDIFAWPPRGIPLDHDISKSRSTWRENRKHENELENWDVRRAEGKIMLYLGKKLLCKYRIVPFRHYASVNTGCKSLSTASSTSIVLVFANNSGRYAVPPVAFGD